VIAVLAVLWVSVGVLALIWFLWTRRLGPRRYLTRTHHGVVDPAAAGFDDEWIYGERARANPRPSPQELEDRARKEAEAIVEEAELKAREIIAAAEAARSQIESELAREQADLAEKSRRIAEFLASTLEEVERTSANGSATARSHELEQLEALQDELRRRD